MEKEIFLDGYYNAFAMTTGPCRFCRSCDTTKPCKYPHQARPANFRHMENVDES
ncbi:MAG: hypothetical protein DRJ11_07845 [Candidatus Aminicenantes bacterium]|nr:MAG: hypothetical protein DRJ11_07845 [Candidatus Aminicenantes bacterium]